MNCEKYQDLMSDFVDGLLTPQDYSTVEAHLTTCVGCAEVRDDLTAIIGFCLEDRGRYDAVPNEQALWQRISNILEAEAHRPAASQIPVGAGWWFRLMNRSWRMSFPQLTVLASALILVVSLVTIFGMRSLTSNGGASTAGFTINTASASVKDRYRQQQQVIDYWNQRVELNKARWSPQMRQTFDSNMSVIDAAVNDSMKRLAQDPHDEISEEILTGALNDKVELLKEFAEL
jgi:hypothetical protein